MVQKGVGTMGQSLSIHCNINLAVICNNSAVPSLSRNSYAKIYVSGVEQIPIRSLNLPDLLLLIIPCEFWFLPLVIRQD